MQFRRSKQYSRTHFGHTNIEERKVEEGEKKERNDTKERSFSFFDSKIR